MRAGGRGVTTALVALAAAAVLSARGERSVIDGGFEAWQSRLFTVQLYVAVAAMQSLLLVASTPLRSAWSALTTEMLAELGVRELLQKPVDHESLTRAVARAVSGASANAA